MQFNHNWVGEMLHDMGLSWQKPMRRARERNEDQITAWREHHQKVSVLGSLVYQPGNDTIEVVCDFHPDAYVRAPQAAAFVHRLLAEFPGRRIDIIWDRLNAHRSKLVKELTGQHPLHLHFLPGYAPDLNPAEMLWCLSKYHRMANHAIDEVEKLHAEAARTINEVAQQPELCRACFAYAGLALLKTGGQ